MRQLTPENIEYYQGFINRGSFSPQNREFYQGVLDSIKKQGRKASDRQYAVLQRMVHGGDPYSSKNEHIYNKNTQMNQLNQIRQLIRESINNYLSEIEEAGNIEATEAKLRKVEEAMAKRKKMVAMEGLDEDMKGMIDEKKIKDLQNEMKILEKKKKFYEKQLDKFKKKSSKGEEPKEIVDENEDKAMDESILHMQKLAGIITNEEYSKKLEEISSKKTTEATEAPPKEKEKVDPKEKEKVDPKKKPFIDPKKIPQRRPKAQQKESITAKDFVKKYNQLKK